MRRVTVMNPGTARVYSFNIKYQENADASSTTLSPMRKKKLCVDLPPTDYGWSCPPPRLVRSCVQCRESHLSGGTP